jgi:hypothetical protein
MAEEREIARRRGEGKGRRRGKADARVEEGGTRTHGIGGEEGRGRRMEEGKRERAKGAVLGHSIGVVGVCSK